MQLRSLELVSMHVELCMTYSIYLFPISESNQVFSILRILDIAVMPMTRFRPL